MDLDSLNLPKLEKAWKSKDLFTLSKHQVCILGKVYLKYTHVVVKSNLGASSSGSLGVNTYLLKDPINAHMEERKRSEKKTCIH